MKPKRTFLGLHHCKLYALTFLLVMGCINSFAQTGSKAVKVTISPKSGNIISTRSESALEAGSEGGYGSLFIHNQAPLTYTTTDQPVFSADGLMRNHTGNIRFYDHNTTSIDDDRVVHITGIFNSFAALAVPKGYRITKYTIRIKNNLKGSYGQADYEILNKSFQFANGTQKLTWGQTTDWYFGEIPQSDVAVENARKDNSGMQWIGTPIRIYHTGDGKTKTYELTRGNGTTDNLGNVIYFTFIGDHSTSNTLAGFEYESFEVDIAPDVEFPVSISPSNVSEELTNLVENGFETRKIDVGEIKRIEKNGKKFLAYMPSNIKQMEATVKLFHESAVENGTWKKTTGSNQYISALQSGSTNWNALKSGVYYIEAPTKIVNTYADGKTNTVPVGYRITGATFKYTYGTSQSGSQRGFRIKKSGVNAYLNRYLQWTSFASSWEQDALGRIYMQSGSGAKTYLTVGSRTTSYDYTITTTTNISHASMNWFFDTEGRLYNLNYGSRYYLTYVPAKGSTAAQTVLTYYSRGEYPKREAAGSSFTPQNFTLKIYDKTGTTVERTENVSATNSNGTVSIDGLNNDAVKFAIENTTGMALVNVDVKMEPLNPYVSTADIVCTGAQGEEMTRTFTNATDFKMGGDLFVYKVPLGFSTPSQGTFSFRNLKSLFADETYLNCDPRDGKVRYSFVGSKYTPANGNDLYGSGYDPNHSYLDKIDVNVAGNKAFLFNNSAELDRNRNTLSTLYLTETPFSAAAYTAQGGNFNAANAVVQIGETKTLYLFTKDETRYNIAPTTKEQHDAYAYYTTNIELTTGNYTPKVEWTKIYDKTNYYKTAADQDNEEAMYGAKITTTDAGFDTEGNASYGYLTLSQIKDAMTTALGGSNAPASFDQILYVDNSELFSVIGSTNDASTGIMSMNTFRNPLAKNAIIYLPYRSAAQATTHNVAVMKEGSTTDFTSPVDFQLIDKNPFFAPFSIQLAADKYATYARQVTYQGYGTDTYASIVLPFALSVDANGEHKDDLGGFYEFTVGKMKDNGLTYTSTPSMQGTDYHATAQFSKLTADAAANTDYMVRLPRTNATPQVLFTVRQKGAFIEKTNSKNQLIAGETVQNTLDGAAANLTSYHTYSGVRMNKATNQDVFYFSYNKFVALRNLRKDVLYQWPFRAVYKFNGSPAAAAKAFTAMEIAFDDTTDDKTPTGIDELNNDVTLAVTTTDNTIITKSKKDTEVRIHSLTGQMVARTTVKAGETRTFHVPTGIYIVNGKKITVK